jgi:hypothetical protein
MKTLALAGLLLGGIAMTSAQTIEPINTQGSYEIGLSFDWFSPQHGDSTTTLNLNPGMFVTNQIFVGVPLSWSHTSGADATSFGLEGRFYFMNNTPKPPQFQPFVGVEGVWFHETGGTNDSFIGGKVGAEYFLSNDVSLLGDLTFGRDRVAGVSTNNTEFFIGFAVHFAGRR